MTRDHLTYLVFAEFAALGAIVPLLFRVTWWPWLSPVVALLVAGLWWTLYRFDRARG